MAKESKLQAEIIRFLKANGAYVIKTKAAPGTPVGCPDIIFLWETQWGAIEVKASPTAPFRVGQEATLKRLKKFNPYVYRAYPDNWPTIRAKLSAEFFV